jgi:ring-1,2-phenylacetyl-CoA epoxidase subunit PaaC
VSARAPSRTDAVIAAADDELVIGWRDSEWTGIAPTLEEDVAFSSIAQNEIGHARALYELAARELGGDADALAFDRAPAEYRCCPLAELRLLDWADTIARRWLYEAADAVRVEALVECDWAELAALARKIEREEAYHRLHASMWMERIGADERVRAALTRLWPLAAGMLAEPERGRLRERVSGTLPWMATDTPPAACDERGAHTTELEPLWREMTMVRRLEPGASW